MLLLIDVDKNLNNGSSTKCLGIISPDSDLIVRGNRRLRFPLPVFDIIKEMLPPDEDPARKQRHLIEFRALAQTINDVNNQNLARRYRRRRDTLKSQCNMVANLFLHLEHMGSLNEKVSESKFVSFAYKMQDSHILWFLNTLDTFDRADFTGEVFALYFARTRKEKLEAAQSILNFLLGDNPRLSMTGSTRSGIRQARAIYELDRKQIKKQGYRHDTTVILRSLKDYL